jgi:hypothetical protein
MKLVLALLLAQTNWTLPPQFRSAGYERLVRDGAVVLSGPGPGGALTQTFDATPWRGQTVRLRASIRVQGAGAAQLILRVDRPAGELGFFDNMGDRPIHAGEWATYTVEGEVAPDAVSVETGVLSSGKASVLVKDVSFEKLAAPTETPAIRANYAKVDAAYAAGDLSAVAALALPDAEIVLPNAHLRLADAIASQKGAKVESRTAVTHVRVDGDEATVWTNNESFSGVQGVLSSNRDVWARAGDGWKLRRSTLIATRPVLPPDVRAGVRQYAGMPDWAKVRILLWQGEHPPALDGFTVIPPEELDPRYADAAAARAVDYLKEHAPEEAGPALLAFQGTDPSRVAATVRVFEQHREATGEWAHARHDALLVYQSKTLQDRPAEAIAANVVWFASEALPNAKILAVAPEASAAAPLVRNRYGKQVYTVGELPRELLGDSFLDLARVPAATPLGRWIAAQKFPFDAIAGR